MTAAPGGSTGPDLAAIGGWRHVLGRLTRHEDLSPVEARAAMDEILAGNATNAQIAGFIIGLRMKGESVEELSGFVEAMLAHAVPVKAPDGIIDTCGTGGDGSHSINVSTIAAFVVAGTGQVVCKHGGRAASSAAGSADVMEALGVTIDLGPEGAARCLEEAGIAFLFAPRYHPALRHAGPVRGELGVRTTFNFLAPMANPARPRRQMVGVSDKAMAEKMVGVLAAGGTQRALVVYGHDGLDELTTTTTSTIVDFTSTGAQDLTSLRSASLRSASLRSASPDPASLRSASDGGPGGSIRTYEVDPAALGLAPARPDDLRGADPATNAGYARAVLEGKPGPHRDIVVLNAAAALVASGSAADLAAGLEQADRSITSGGAAAALDRLVSVSKSAASDTAR